jgi:hypothetical protein
MTFLYFPIQSQTKTGTIEGTVFLENGQAVTAVTVTVTSPNLIGEKQATVSNEKGKFRFVALPTGTYMLTVTMEGFKPQKHSNLRLHAGKTITVDFVLEMGQITEIVEVKGVPAIIDIKDSQTITTNMTPEFLQKLPNRGVEGALNFTPGVSNLSAFGSAVSNSNNYMVDGVKVNSPEAGESGMSPVYDSIEEISVLGVGAPAEYGGFSGAVVNTVMKSGGNDFHGMVTFFMRAPGLHSENWANYPDLIERRWGETYDANFNLGGPVIKNKLWFFTSGNYNYFQDHIDDYDGLTESGNGKRIAGKLTWQPGPKDRFSLWLALNPSTINNYGTEPLMAPEANTNENHKAFYFNSNNLHTFSDSTFMELKIGGFYKKGENEVDANGTPAHFDEATEILSGSFGETYYRTSQRFQANLTLSHYAEDFIKGDHDFKFGVEVEMSKVNIAYGYPSGRFYLDYDGEPYIMDEWDGEEGNPKSRRISFFAQDTWEVSKRLVINPGVRINHWRGYVPGVSGAAYAPKTGIAPRIGITYDIFGDNSTALKLHYGKYYHGMMAQFYFRLQPQGGFREYLIGPIYDEFMELPEGTHGEDEWVLDWEDEWENEYTVDPNLKMAYLNQYVIGIERELGRDISVGASFIYRTNHDLQDRVNLTGEWEQTTWVCDYPGIHNGKTFTVWQRINPGENQYYLTNPKKGEDYGAAFPGIVAFTPSRKYKGFQLTFEKRFSNGWMLNASYAWGEAWGTDNNDWGEFGENRGSMLGASTMFSNPNYQINAEGPLGIDPTHQVKIYGAIDIPVVDVVLGFSYGFTSGSPYNSNVMLPRDIDPDAVSFEDNVFIYGEERGAYRYPGIHDIDIRLEKFFKLGKIRIGVLADVFNLLNADTETEYETNLDPFPEFPFGYVSGIRSPRTFRLGIRLEF